MDKKRPLENTAGAAALFVLTMLGGVAIWRRKALPTLLHKPRSHPARPRVEPQPASPSHQKADTAPHDPFDWGGASLAGPGAEDAVRHLVLDVLTHPREHAIQLVLARPDAWRLLGISANELQDERVPGLSLTDDDQQAYAHLRRPGFSRRLLITYDGNTPVQQGEQCAAVSVATWTEPSVQISPDGVLVPCSSSDSTIPGKYTRAPLLSRPDAAEKLRALPTLDRCRRMTAGRAVEAVRNRAPACGEGLVRPRAGIALAGSDGGTDLAGRSDRSAGARTGDDAGRCCSPGQG
ncbi:hypothetical protein [Actinomadura nitritigenes]|uniref:Uncharacterized protein n=1 Tax=Actinomadura nitritigenes TaxID=134602 RepID=A0ABS3R1X7_9ACTN|nr:hypothetical protein [Actinomadura nitritigenes]MBO2440254.1 hypothetical protein [Actinomadura nitritigenes]